MSFPELSAFARHLERTSPEDQDEHVLNAERAQELYAFVKKSSHPELAACMQAARSLIETLSESSQHASNAELLSIACQAVRALERSMELEDFSMEPVEGASEKEAAGDSDEADAPQDGQEDSEQSDSELEDAPELNPDLSKINNMVLGKMLLELKQATPEQVAGALKMHREKGIPMGECMLVNGVSADHLLASLKLQRELRTIPAEEAKRKLDEATAQMLADKEDLELGLGAVAAAVQEPGQPRKRGADSMFLGEVLIGAGIIDQEQLDEAMMINRLEGISMGQALMRIKAITDSELKHGLDLQRRLRNVIGLSA